MIGGMAMTTKATITSKNPSATSATETPRDTDFFMRNSMIGLSPMAMKSASPTMMSALVISAKPRNKM